MKQTTVLSYRNHCQNRAMAARNRVAQRHAHNKMARASRKAQRA